MFHTLYPTDSQFDGFRAPLDSAERMQGELWDPHRLRTTVGGLAASEWRPT